MQPEFKRPTRNHHRRMVKGLGTRICRRIGSFIADSQAWTAPPGPLDRQSLQDDRFAITINASKHDARHTDVPTNRQLHRRFDKRGAAPPRPLGCKLRQDAQFCNHKKTKRPSLPAVALDEEHRRDSMLQDLCLPARRARHCLFSCRWRACSDLPECVPSCLPARAGNRAWLHAPCRDA